MKIFKLIVSALAWGAVAIAGLQTVHAQKKENQMSIRVAGYEVLLEDSNQGKKAHNDRWRPRRFYTRQGMFEIGVNEFRTCAGTYAGYTAAENGFLDLDIARSLHITAHVSTISQTLSRNNTLGIVMSPGLSYNQYSLDTPVALEKRDLVLRPGSGNSPATGRPLKKSKLRALTFHVPLVVEWQPSRKFFVAAGGYADVLMWSDAKWKSPKEKLSSPYMNFLNAGLTARIGFSEWYCFGNYALTELFKTGRGPVVSPYTIGIGFVMW